MKYGFIKVAVAVPEVMVADCGFNTARVAEMIGNADKQGVEIIVFPELCITGYSCQDLFRQSLLVDNAEHSLKQLMSITSETRTIAIIGLPVRVGDILLNCAAVIQKGKLLGIVPKTFLPNYGEFYEKRWFTSAQGLMPVPLTFAGQSVEITSSLQLFQTTDGVRFGIEICEDVWSPIPPSSQLALAGADIIFNLSASDELIGKHDYLLNLLSQQSARSISAYVYSGCGYGESTQDVVYGGNALIYENGRLLAEGKRFSLEPQMVTAQVDIELLRNERMTNTTYASAQKQAIKSVGCAVRHNAVASSIGEFTLKRRFNPYPFIPNSIDMNASCSEIFNIQVCGLAKRLAHTRCRTVVIGISGGLDSTLALLVCVKTFDKLKLDRKGIVGVTMPGFGTTDRTHDNAVDLMSAFGITINEISISASVLQHFEDIGHDPNLQDVTYENSQARERTQILMDLSNQLGGIVIGTGDLSELALGWATYNGDHMSMYGVNASIPKTLIRHLVRHVAMNEVDEEARNTLLDIIDTPISPELVPADEHGNITQKTEDLVGPYELHDFFLYHMLRFGFSPKKLYVMAIRAFDGEDGAPHYDGRTIQKWLRTFIRRFFAQQFKRSCLPDGPKVGSVSLSPRGDWRMPSDAVAKMWIDECAS